MAECLNHPTVETEVRCARCAQYYCDSCLVDFMGQRFCGICRDYRLYELQHPGGPGAVYSGTGTVDLGRWIGGGWNIISGDMGTWILASLISWVIIGVSCGLLYGPMMAGMQMMAFRKMTYGTVEISNLFDGFQRFGNSFLLTLIRGFVLGGIILTLYFGLIGATVASVAANPNAAGPPGFLVGALLIYYPAVFFVSYVDALLNIFTLSQIAARNVGPGKAIADNLNVVKRNFLMFSVFTFLLWLFEILAAIPCYIGLLIVSPLVAAARAQAYADHFGIEGWDRS